MSLDLLNEGRILIAQLLVRIRCVVSQFSSSPQLLPRVTLGIVNHPVPLRRAVRRVRSETIKFFCIVN